MSRRERGCFGDAGAVRVPFNTRLARDEYGYLLEHSGAKALVADRSLADQVPDGIDARIVWTDEYEQLLDLLHSRFVNPAGAARITGTGCDTDEMTVAGLTDERLERAQRFLRRAQSLNGEAFLLAVQAFLCDPTPPDALPPAEKELLQNAAVIGKVFWPGAVAAPGASGWGVSSAGPCLRIACSSRSSRFVIAPLESVRRFASVPGLPAGAEQAAGAEVGIEEGLAVESEEEPAVGFRTVATVGRAVGTGVAARDSTIEALKPLLDKELGGFGEIFRMLSFQEIGAAGVLRRARSGGRQGRVVAGLPGSAGGCGAGGAARAGGGAPPSGRCGCAPPSWSRWRRRMPPRRWPPGARATT